MTNVAKQRFSIIEKTERIMKRVRITGYIWALLAIMLFITSVCANVNVYADTDTEVESNTDNAQQKDDSTDTETQKEFRAVWIAY